MAQYFGQYLSDICNKKDQVFIAISGGTTPQYFFDVISAEFNTSIDWQKIWLFWVDERCVPSEHPDSNYGMTQRHLLSKVSVPNRQIFRIKGELPHDQMLSLAISDIQQNVPNYNGWPRFDLVVLGMGDDGHTASIFPHEINIWNSPAICDLGHHPLTGQTRITLTGCVINNASHILFLITGSGKAIRIREIFNNDAIAQTYPASLVDKSKCEWLLDNEAASLLLC
jgi:6-phosphogluconolactonase